MKKALVSSYSYMWLKSVISDGGQGPSGLASNNERSLSEVSVSHAYINGQHIAMTSWIIYACIIHGRISYKLKFDAQKFEHKLLVYHLATFDPCYSYFQKRWASDKLIMFKFLHIKVQFIANTLMDNTGIAN